MRQKMLNHCPKKSSQIFGLAQKDLKSDFWIQRDKEIQENFCICSRSRACDKTRDKNYFNFEEEKKEVKAKN
jgi:hypothetical protein